MKNFQPFFKNKKVLLVGLGQLGGGVGTAKFLLKNNVNLAITDLRTNKELRKSLNKLKKFKMRFRLGGHDDRDFKNSDIIVFNPAVSAFSVWVKKAKKFGKEIYNDYTLFLKLLSFRNRPGKFIGITGTRGKTTVANWTAHFLSPAVLGGNIPGKGLLNIIDEIKNDKPAVLELSSYQLEYLDKKTPTIAPHIAVITNLFQDHLNRYKTMVKYGRIKSLIFSGQTRGDFLILNNDDKNLNFFLKEKPKSRLYFFSLKSLPPEKNGVFFRGEKIFFQENGDKKNIVAVKNLSPHQKHNLLASILVAYLSGESWETLTTKINNLPVIAFREEIVLKNKSFLIVNDSAATSPDGTIAAIERFKRFKNRFFLICGGTDKDLDFSGLAGYIKKNILPRNLFLLKGSATLELISCLNKIGYFKKSGEKHLHDTLEEIIRKLSKVKKGVIVFSPAAASFEKFKNEFDRGNKFNKLVKKYFN
ncbi:MAG: UDP-N-acetylmuramoyl-L-alanine--D-glutamate ligase [Candidatus Wolfebacteria bacterium]|nr:UDP-N-acetylmuramoyl-L-alanine--D-glutamate ligase [Candidatus Wolfebacteria bacterium]